MTVSLITQQIQKHQNSVKTHIESGICITVQDKFFFIDYQEILYLRASGNYTRIFLRNEDKILVSKTLRVFEKKLNPSTFFRTHKNSMVNINYVLKYLKNGQELIVMKNGEKLLVSRRRKQALLEALYLYFKRI